MLVLNETLAVFVLDTTYLKMLVMTLPYALVFSFGLQINYLNKTELRIIYLFSLLVFVFIAYFLYAENGHFITTQDYKYSPRLYYLSYAMFVIVLLWKAKNMVTKLLDRIHFLPLMTFIGSHTMWIYLWHILFLMFYERILVSPVLLFTAVMASSIFLTFLQVSVIQYVSCKINSDNVTKNLKIIFEG